MDREDNTHYFNLEYLNYSEPQVKDINAKPNKAFKFDGMTAYVYELEKVWEVHVRIWEDEPEPEPHRVDKMIEYIDEESKDLIDFIISVNNEFEKDEDKKVDLIKSILKSIQIIFSHIFYNAPYGPY